MSEEMSTERQRRWCLYTSAGDKNSIRLWLEGTEPRRWDLVVAYYGDDDREFSEISELATYAFRTKGGKFQNLKGLITENPKFFDQYSHVWVCDDDIQMSTAQIDEAFAITEMLDLWVAQPAFRPEGKISHWITCYAGPKWDYRLVNYVEVTMPIFRHDKFVEFITAYDGSLTGWGIEHWYINFFSANDFGRFAVIDKVQVINPHDEQKGGREIDRLQSTALRRAAWDGVRQKFGFVEYPPKVFAYCKLAPRFDQGSSPAREGRSALQGVFPILDIFRRKGWHDALWYLKCGLTIRRQRRSCIPLKSSQE